jgi:hypothetical protein
MEEIEDELQVAKKKPSKELLAAIEEFKTSLRLGYLWRDLNGRINWGFNGRLQEDREKKQN